MTVRMTAHHPYVNGCRHAAAGRRPRRAGVLPHGGLGSLDQVAGAVVDSADAIGVQHAPDIARMLEVVESIKIAEQGLARYPTAQGSHRIEPPRTLPAGETYVETECPRGQMGFMVVGRPANLREPVSLLPHL